MDLPIFIIHYTPLKERKVHIDDQLNKYNFKSTYITDYDKEDLTKSVIDWFGNIKLAEISLSCKHMSVYKKMVNENIEEAIILEDDVTLHDNFYDNLQNYYKQLPEDWDLLFFGSGWNLHVPKKLVEESNKNVFLKNNNGYGRFSPEVKVDGWPICGGSTRCLDSYIIKKSAAAEILRYCINKRINAPFDLFLNQCFRDLKLKVYWGEPSLCKQDTFKSSIKN